LYQHLSPKHEEMLLKGSAIAPDVLAARGVRTISSPRELPKAYSARQRRRGPGWLATVHRPNGKTATLFRPDAADPDNPGNKYEQEPKARGGAGNVLDVHPFSREWIDDPDVPVVFVEGTKKGDSLLSALRAAGERAVVVSIVGVYNWLHRPDGTQSEPISDMADILLEGRSATVMFDSDVLVKWQVQLAAKRLAEYLRDERGARVYMTFLDGGEVGAKVGVDDYLANGGTLAGLRLLTRRYEPDDFRLVRLARDQRLRAMVDDLERAFWAEEWKGVGGHTDRDVTLKLIEAAASAGRPVEDGLLVFKSWGSLQVEAKLSSRTLSKSLSRIEDTGFIVRRVQADNPRKCGGFVLRANVNHNRTEQGSEPNVTDTLHSLYACTLHLRPPRLRWSSPGYKPRRGTAKGTRRVRDGAKPQSRQAVKRLGKIRGAVLDAIDAAGGASTVEEICETLQRNRSRDLVRFKASDKGHDGPVVMLLEAGIVQWVSDVQTRREVLRLTADWQERLHAARVLGQEVTGGLEIKRDDGETVSLTVEGADEKAVSDLARKRRAYRNRHKLKPQPAPSDDELGERRESYPDRRRAYIERAIAQLFDEKPEYRSRRVGQITCQLVNYLASDFPRGLDGAPKDAEVAAILEGVAA
jgi:hypothetical protein